MPRYSLSLFVEKLTISQGKSVNSPEPPPTPTDTGPSWQGALHDHSSCYGNTLPFLIPVNYKVDLGANMPLHCPLPSLVEAFVETWLSVGGRDIARRKCPQMLMPTKLAFHMSSLCHHLEEWSLNFNVLLTVKH